MAGGSFSVAFENELVRLGVVWFLPRYAESHCQAPQRGS